MSSIRLADAARWDQQLPHQLAAWNWLQEQLTPEQLAHFAETYRSGPAAAKVVARPSNPLAPFAYFPQLDNGPEGWRHCQTSSISMALAYLKVPGIRDDTDYLRVVERYGDTTQQTTHQMALKALGVRARFRQDMNQAEVIAEIKSGLPVCLGVLHHGPVSAPTGGGHWIICFGFNVAANAYICHDPYGELDLVNGGWAAVGGLHGMRVNYSYRNLNPRWCVGGGNTGWAWTFS